jgi:AhpD family alkylhydroperoxidase
MGVAMTGSPAAESRFGMTELDDLPADLRERIGAIAAKSGFVPNIFRALGHRPAELRAFLDYHDALMDPPAASNAGGPDAGGLSAGRPGAGWPNPAGPGRAGPGRAGPNPAGPNRAGLSKAERELVVVATSSANHCLYCIVAHGAILRIRSKDPHIADRVAANPWQAELPDRSRAIVDLALALTRTPELFGDADIAKARDAGLTDDEIWDVGAITALFAASNRLAHLTALQPNPEFYLMGRTPRA